MSRSAMPIGAPYGHQHYDIPEHVMTRIVGVPLARLFFGAMRPAIFAMHCAPMNRLCRAHGMAPLGSDLRRVYTEADQTLYADVPELVHTENLPPHHQYLGPVLWSGPVARPDWWDSVPNDRPIIYVTLGSSGSPSIFSTVLQVLADLDVTVLGAKAGYAIEPATGGRAFLADYLPGAEAAARASVVICNGGSPTSHQALAAGVPVLGIPSNLDQHLNMQGILKYGAGQALRADSLCPRSVRESVQALLKSRSSTLQAQTLSNVFSQYDAPGRFRQILRQVLSRDGSRALSPEGGLAA